MPDWLWQGLLLLIAGAGLSLVPTHIYCRRSLKVREPVWCIWSANLARTLTSNESALRLMYGDRSVPSVSVSWVMIWNNGREALDRSTIALGNPLRIVGNRGATILEASVASQSDRGNGASIELTEDGSAVVEFDYLNYRQGCIVSIIHTGTNPGFVSVQGGVVNSDPLRQVDVMTSRIRGLPPAAVEDISFSQGRHERSLNRFWLTGISLVLVTSLICWPIWSWQTALAVGFFGGVSTLFLGGLIFSWISVTIGYRLPIGLDDINDERTLSEYWDRWKPPPPALFPYSQAD